MAGDTKETGGEIRALDYPACSGAAAKEWNGWEEAGDDRAAQAEVRARSARGNTAGNAADESNADAARRSFESGRARGREEGRLAEREALAAETEHSRRQVAALMARFGEESECYLRAVEQEAVKLALAVAARILRREAAMDPLLLTGAVRVALGQLAASSEVRLLVPAAELELWQEAIAHMPHLAVKPVVMAGEGMRLGDCAIESQMGTVDLGVRSQLEEIERGFFDRSVANGVGGQEAGAVEERA